MGSVYRKYIDNLNLACTLVKPQLAPGMGEEVIAAIRSSAEKLFAIHQENDEILKEILFSKTGQTLSAEEASELSALADELFSYNRSPDTGIAYKIHKLLYEYGEYHQDINLMIRELYYQGVTLLYMNVSDSDGIGLFNEQIGEYFKEGASYLERYEEIEDAQTRGYIIRCMGNMKHVIEELRVEGEGEYRADAAWKKYMRCFSQTMEVINSAYYRQMNPEISWDNFAYTMHFDRTKFLSVLRQPDPDPVITQGVMESAEYVYRYQEEAAKAKNRGLGARIQYVYSAARYHAGSESAEELVETLFRMCESADIKNFSGDNIWILLYTPEYLLYYVNEVTEDKRQNLEERMREALSKQQEYLFRLPRNEYALQVARSLQAIAGYMVNRDERFCQRLLDYILACHPPTFVHSKVVGLLARWFCGRMAEVRPELLAGTLGFATVDEISEKLETLLEFVYQSGLRHDLGKCMLLNYIGLYSRRLLDEEFACIKLHTVFGCKLLEAVGMEDMAKIAHYHHRSFDGAGGYPCFVEECPISIRSIVDIITVVDSLDAGTDNVGRSYAAAKTYEQLVEELRKGKGTRYAPGVVELLDDPAFYEETKKFLDDSRRQVYVEVYCNG